MKTKIITFLLLSFLASMPCQGQQKRVVDSLKQAIKTATTPPQRFDALYGLAYEYSAEIDSISLIYANEAYDLACKLLDTARIIKGGRIKAAELRRTESINESIKFTKTILRLAKNKKDTAEIKILLTALATAFTLKAQPDSALQCNFELVCLSDKQGDKQVMSIALHNIGVIYYKMEDASKALEYYKKSLQLKKEINYDYDMDRHLINMALSYNFLRIYDSAKQFLIKGLATCGDKCSSPIIIEAEIALGMTLLESNQDEDEALVHFFNAYNVAHRTHNYRFQAENAIEIGRVYLKKKDYVKAKSYFTKAESISLNRGYRFALQLTYWYLSQLNKQIGDIRSQALYQSKYISIKDSISGQQILSSLSQLSTAFKERENIKTIAQKDQILSLQTEVIQRQQRQYYFILAIAVLLVALAALTFYFSKRQQKSNHIISNAKKVIEDQNKRLEKYSSELEIKVQERTNNLHKAVGELDYFIYKSSHDIRGPIATLKRMTSIALMDLKDPLAIEYFKKFDVTTDKLNVTLTRLQLVNYVNHFTPNPKPINFKSIVDDIIACERKNGAPEHFSFISEIDPDCEIITSDRYLVHTILENLINNSIKFRTHSNRIIPFVKLTLRMQNNNQWMNITVEDNGIGISKEYTSELFKMSVRSSEQLEINGVGLFLIKLATEKINGKISLVHSGIEGSLFRLSLPITKPHTPTLLTGRSTMSKVKAPPKFHLDIQN